MLTCYWDNGVFHISIQAIFCLSADTGSHLKDLLIYAFIYFKKKYAKTVRAPENKGIPQSAESVHPFHLTVAMDPMYPHLCTSLRFYFPFGCNKTWLSIGRWICTISPFVVKSEYFISFSNNCLTLYVPHRVVLQIWHQNRVVSMQSISSHCTNFSRACV